MKLFCRSTAGRGRCPWSLLLRIGLIFTTLGTTSGPAQDVYGKANPSNENTPIAPPFRSVSPTLRKDPSPAATPYSTQVKPYATIPGSGNSSAPTITRSAPVVQTEPQDSNEVSPTSTADSLFHLTPGLRLSDQTGLAAPNASGELTSGPVVASEPGGRLVEPGFRVGIFDVRPGLVTSTVFDDNINSVPNNSPNKKSDFIFNLTPSVEFAYAPNAEADFWNFDFIYDPTIQILDRNPDQNNFQQNYSLNLSYEFSKLRIGLRQSYFTLVNGDPDTGTRVSRTLFNNAIYANYAVGEKTSIDLTSDLGTRDVDSPTGFSTYNPNLSMFVNYLYAPKLTLSVGLVGGITYIEHANAQYNFSPTVRALYDYSEKTKFFAQAGINYLDYGGNNGDSIDLNFQGGGTYAVNPLLNLNLTANRSQQASNTIYGVNTITTGLTGGADYHIFHDYHVALNGGYEHAEYVAAVNTVSAGRVDDYIFLTPSLIFSPTDFWDLSFSYSYRQNFSNNFHYAFEGNQVSVASTLRF